MSNLVASFGQRVRDERQCLFFGKADGRFERWPELCKLWTSQLAFVQLPLKASRFRIDLLERCFERGNGRLKFSDSLFGSLGVVSANRAAEY
jgi:hypothetical protein